MFKKIMATAKNTVPSAMASKLPGGLGSALMKAQDQVIIKASNPSSSSKPKPKAPKKGEFAQQLLDKLGLPDLQKLRNFRLEDYIDKVNIFKGLKPPAWLSDEFQMMFNNFPQWWQQKTGNFEQFFDPNNPDGLMSLMQRIMPTDLISSTIGKTKSFLKDKAIAGWDKIKEFAKERPGVTTLSIAAFFYPILAPLAL